MKTLTLILGDMLFAGLPGTDPESRVLMVEDLGLATRVRHHRQKIVLFFSAMRHFASLVEDRPVTYIEFEQRQSLFDVLRQECQADDIECLETYLPADRFMRDKLSEFAKNLDLNLRLLPNPMFLTPPNFWHSYESDRKRLVMGDFYALQRQRLSLLVEANGDPVGGKWSFDEENRRALPKTLSVPEIWPPQPDPLTRAVIQLVDQEFATHPGRATEFAYPVTHAEAEDWLSDFLETRLDLFGPYEDAIPQRTRTVFHGVLSPMLNCGLLTPQQVVDATMARHAQRPVPLASLEGFLRQVVGWREFVYGISHRYPASNETADKNFFGHQRKLGPAWWSAETGLPPLDQAIMRAQQTGWCHHIERLMVLGSVMLMCEAEPADTYRWFMEMFVDSADWVMGPNVLGMSQFADGGLLATKPYLSGSSYLLKMGDYAKGDWCEVWDGLYWRFLDRNREKLAKNPRMAMMVRGADKLDPVRKQRIYDKAEAFIDRVMISPPA